MEDPKPSYVYWIERRGRGGCSCRPPRSTWLLFSRSKLFDAVDYRGADLGDPGRRRRFRFRAAPPGYPDGAHAHRGRALRLPKQALLYVPAAPARAAQSGFTGSGGRRGGASARPQPRPRLRAVHQLPADAGRLRPGVARDRLPDAAAGHRAANPRCSTSSAPRRTACCSPPRRSGRAWTCRANSLSCVIIDKLPFAVPSDPVVEARIARDSGRRRQSVLRLPDPAGGPRAQTGLRAADPQQDRPRAC